MSRPTLQDIADALNTSRVSVWKALTGRRGVSEQLRRDVFSKAAEMGYIAASGRLPGSLPAERESLTISVAVSRPETSEFWVNTIHEIAGEAAAAGINLLYTYLPSEIDDAFTLPSVLTDGSVQGVIVLNVYNKKLIRMLARLALPKVFMDTVTGMPFSELGGDLLLVEGRSCVAQITDHLIKLGKKKIGFIGDVGYAQTNYERFYGYKDAMKHHSLEPDPAMCLTSPLGAESYRTEISAFLDQLPALPEAIVCVSDFVASIVCSLLAARGLRIPEDVMVSGFDGISDLNLPVPLTTVLVNNQEFGIRLARQLIYRIEHPNAGIVVSYIFPRVVFRRSTENVNKESKGDMTI